MPGAFAHLTAANHLCATGALHNMDMPTEAKFILSTHVRYVELGSVSPDYPYLAITLADEGRWADLMHYEKTGELVKHLVERCKALEGEEQKKVFAWLCGFMSHVMADVTIHPVVELKVGEYAENKTAHRVCEMNQDAFIWETLGLGEIGLADRVRLNIGSCVDDTGHLDNTIASLWHSALTYIHQGQGAPNIQKWHQGFQTVVDNADEGYRFFKWARHVAANVGVLYPRPDEVDGQYIENLETPHGNMHYQDIFMRAVSNIQTYVGYIGNAIFSEDEHRSKMYITKIKNWNLDTGRDELGVLTAWQE